VRNRVFTLVAVLACAAGMSAWAAARQPQQPNTPMSLEEVLKTYRTDLQNSRASVINRNVILTPEQAAKFWPVFERYQKEQSAIMDEQMRGIQSYIAGIETLDDSAALAFMQAHLDRDANMAALRRQWLSEFQSVLPAKLAVRVMQIDRRISLAQQTEFTTQIPLVQ
jgi:Spy/CpxP family protein refolding chaperone